MDTLRFSSDPSVEGGSTVEAYYTYEYQSELNYQNPSQFGATTGETASARAFGGSWRIAQPEATQLPTVAPVPLGGTGTLLLSGIALGAFAFRRRKAQVRA